MAAKAHIKQTTKQREKKIPADSLKCNLCGGRGYVKKGYNKKKS